MAKKPSVSTITSGYYSTTTLNDNFTATRDAFDNTLSLDGSTPNAMLADLDMNNNDILNVSEVTCSSMTLGGVAVTAGTIADSLPASGITLVDLGDYYVATHVEAALEEIGLDIETLQLDVSNAEASITTLQSDVLREVIQLACSDETTDLTTGTAKVTFRMPFAMTLTAVRASVTTAPTDATLIVDINYSGTTVLSTKLTIDATEKTSTTAAVPAVISDTALADDAEVTVDIDQVGSTVAGAGLKVTLIGTRA